MELSHIDGSGRAVMVDVSGKRPVRRRAVASGRIGLRPKTVGMLREGRLEKGDAIACARTAGIMAAKRTAGLIPLCHSLPVDHVAVDCSLQEEGVEVRASVTTTARTGVEMEALTAVSVALLTLYDMCKAVDGSMVMGEIRLLEKTKEEAD